jgi:hypothetical protein
MVYVFLGRSPIPDHSTNHSTLFPLSYTFHTPLPLRHCTVLVGHLGVRSCLVFSLKTFPYIPLSLFAPFSHIRGCTRLLLSGSALGDSLLRLNLSEPMARHIPFFPLQHRRLWLRLKGYRCARVRMKLNG